MDISEEVGNLGFSFLAMNPHSLEEVQSLNLISGMDFAKGRASESVFIHFPSSPRLPTKAFGPSFLW